MGIAIDIRTIGDRFPGIGRYTYHLVQQLVRENDRNELFLIYNPSTTNTRFDVEVFASEPKVQMVPTATRPFSLREQLQLPGELRRLLPAVTHFPHFIMPYAAPRPIIVTIHDIIPVRLPQFFSLRHRILYRISLSLALKSAALIICPSEATRAELKSVFRTDDSRIHVVQEGISKSFHPCKNEELQRVRSFYGLPEKYLLYLGSNKPHKNLMTLVDAYSRLQTPPPLIVAGVEDPRYMQVHRRVDFLGLKDRVRFLGAIDENNLPPLYCLASAFVFPSTYEGFGLPPLEAMACGVPVACSAIPSLCETVGDAALLFNATDPESMAATLDRLLKDENMRADLRERGFRRAAEMSWGRTAQKTLDVYKHVAGTFRK